VEYRGLVKFYSPGPLLSRSALLSHASNKLANTLRNIPPYRSGVTRELTAKLIVQVERILESEGIDLLIVMLPWYKDYLNASRADQTFIINHLRAAGVPLLVPDLPRLGNGEIDGDLFWISHKDRHPNRHYNTLLADQIAEFLKTHTLQIMESKMGL
jgi:hypothetical protein